MNFSVIRSKMEHNASLRKIVSFLRSIGVIHFLHVIQSFVARKRIGNERTNFDRFYETNRDCFDQVFKLLEDDFSKVTYQAVIDYRKTNDIRKLKGVVTEPQYFQNEIVKRTVNEVFIDGGAYIGDTALDYIRLFAARSNNESDKLYLWECDNKNISLIDKMVKGKINYSIVPKAMWSKKTKIRFSLDGSSGSKQDDNCQTLVEADSIDNWQHEEITFIKMDIEGAEIEALKGAEKTIKKYKPKLAICIYHRPSDLFDIPIMIHSWVPEYKIYVRHHSDTYAETVMYAVL